MTASEWTGVRCDKCGRTVLSKPGGKTVVVLPGQDDCQSPMRSLTDAEVERFLRMEPA